MRPLILALLASAVVSLPARVGAQTDPCLRRMVPVNVGGAHGLNSSDLTTSNFEASLHRKSVKIVSVTRDDSPRRVIVALDESGSMRENWKDSVQLARFVLASMRNDDWMGIVTFSNQIQESLPLTQERGSLNVELERLLVAPEAAPRGGTALWDTLDAVTKQFDPPRLGDSIVVVSDGGDNFSNVSAGKSEKLLMEKGVRLFAIVPKAERGGPTPQESGRAFPLSEPVINTGGYEINLMYYPRPTPGDTTGKADAIGAALRMEMSQILTFERVEIELPERIDKPAGWQLHVKGIDDSRQFLAYPHTLAACTNP